MSASAGPQPKRKHTKSKYGCRNCKLRRVKCDETRPLCRNCAVHYTNITECDWDAAPPPRQSRAAAASPPPPEQTVNDPNASQLSLTSMTIDSHLIDPFRTYAPTLFSDVDFLLSYYLSDYVYQCFPFFNTTSIIDVWWSFLREDVLLFNSVLQLSCTHLAKIGQHTKSRMLDSARLSLYTVRLLRERLEQPAAVPSDHTIVATAHFAALEHERHNMNALGAHVGGLRRMVNLRGGLDMLNSMNPMVASIVFWTSMVVSSEPSVLPIAYAEPLPVEYFGFASSDPSRLESASRVPLPPSYINILSDIDIVSQRFSSTFAGLSFQDSLSVVIAMTSLLQRTLYLPISTDAAPGTTTIAEAVRLAALLHLCYPLSGSHPDPTLLIASVSYRLKSSLGHILEEEAAHMEQGTDPLRLWLFSIGAVSTIARDETLAGWFLGHLAIVCNDLGVKSWTEMRGMLTGVMWHAVFCEPSYERVWTAAQTQLIA